MSDARIPVIYGSAEAALPGDAVLFEGQAVPRGGASAAFTPRLRHAAGCACCAGRPESGRALGSLLHARARNEIPFFTRVLVVTTTDIGRLDVADALLNDPVASTCFRAG